jgi:hypothetical protein
MKYFAVALSLLTLGCSKDLTQTPSDVHYSSARSVLLNFEFAGSIIVDRTFGIEDLIRNHQLLYTVGQLNDIGEATGKGAVGRLDATKLTIGNL